MNAAHEVSNDHNSRDARHGEKNSITRLPPHARHDIEMMKKAALAIAMGNGTAACKDVADYVTGDVDAGGIAQALKHFELI